METNIFGSINMSIVRGCGVCVSAELHGLEADERESRFPEGYNQRNSQPIITFVAIVGP